MRRVMVDLSATLLHPGHTRLLRRAAELGTVVVGLTSDEEVLQRKGYLPELPFDDRRELLLALEDVAEVVETPWLLTEEDLDRHGCELLVHGADNSNPIPEQRLVLLPRTEGVSSSDIRARALRARLARKNQRTLLTPGPGALVSDNLLGLEPAFGRGDPRFAEIEAGVLGWLRELTGKGEVVPLQGSATLALEVGLRNLVRGRALLVGTGYYSARLRRLLPPDVEVAEVPWEQLDEVEGAFDWVLACYVETSRALRLDPHRLRALADGAGARLFLDATASIGLEPDHQVADALGFSSCKGLLGLTGAAFLALDPELPVRDDAPGLMLDLATYRERRVTGPYHALAGLERLRTRHPELRARVEENRRALREAFPDLVDPDLGPSICTLVRGALEAARPGVVMYTPREDPGGTLVCHLHHLEGPMEPPEAYLRLRS